MCIDGTLLRWQYVEVGRVTALRDGTSMYEMERLGYPYPFLESLYLECTR